MRPQAKLLQARELRRDSTVAERKLWEQLRNRQLGGLKFVRQEPVGPYIVDFVCRAAKLIVEVDGATHSTGEEQARDARRTAFLRGEGYRVIRVQTIEVVEAMDGVLRTIEEAVADV